MVIITKRKKRKNNFVNNFVQSYVRHGLGYIKNAMDINYTKILTVVITVYWGCERFLFYTLYYGAFSELK